LLLIKGKRSLSLEVAAHNLRTRAVEFGGVWEDGLFEAVAIILPIKKIQCFVETHIAPGGCVWTAEALLPRGVIAIGATVYDETLNAMALFV
jgi:hypothetical protein